MLRKSIAMVVISLLTLGGGFVNAYGNEWMVSREYKELSGVEAGKLYDKDLEWVELPEYDYTKYAFLGDGKTLLLLSEMFITTTGGTYLDILSVTETEETLTVKVESPRPFSCHAVTKDLWLESTFVLIDNPHSKGIKLDFSHRDSCAREDAGSDEL